MADTHMLEHADRYDAVPLAGQGAVVHQLEPHLAGQASLGRPGAGSGKLLLGQGDARDLCAVVAGQGQRHAAPTAADVQHAHARPQQQLGCDQALLSRLRLLQCLRPSREIGAGILAVGVQQQRIQRAVQVVVVDHVALGAAGRVELRPAFQRHSGQAMQCHDGLPPAAGDVGRQQVQRVVDRAAHRGDGAVHVALAERQPGVQHHAPHRAPIGHGERNGRARGAVVNAGLAVGVADLQAADHEEAPDQAVQGKAHGVSGVAGQNGTLQTATPAASNLEGPACFLRQTALVSPGRGPGRRRPRPGRRRTRAGHPARPPPRRPCRPARRGPASRPPRRCGRR